MLTHVPDPSVRGSEMWSGLAEGLKVAGWPSEPSVEADRRLGRERSEAVDEPDDAD